MAITCNNLPADDHEHCPEHGCVEYVCCVPTMPGTPAVSLVKDSPVQLRAAQDAQRTRAVREDVLAAWSVQPLGSLFNGNRWVPTGLRATIDYRKPGAVPMWDGEPAARCERCTEWVEDVDPATGLCDRCDEYDADRYIA